MATPTSPGDAYFVPLSGSANIDSLLIGTKWGSGTGASLTYSFGDLSNSYYSLPYGSSDSPTRMRAPSPISASTITVTRL